MHWADVIAKKVIAEQPSGNVVATGITPSGEIHVGNMREILTGDIIRRALTDNGDNEAKLIYIGDTIDPLRKLYPFLDKSYEEHIGKPLSEIPCPCGSHQNYAEHFLEPFLATLDQLGAVRETVLTHELYRDGKYAEGTKKVLENIDMVKKVLGDISGRELPDGWVPYTPKCGACGKLKAEATGYEHPFVSYSCPLCGHQGKADIRKDDGKLPWRVDWPTRWWFLGVTVEPFGKDHGAAGGSYDTGAKLIQELFGRDPPPRHVYEWIQLKGQGAMSSSKGIVVTGKEMLQITPPEVLRHLIASTNIVKHIDFDPGLGILNMVDDFDKLEAAYFASELGLDEGRTYEFSSPHIIPHDMTHLSLEDIKTEGMAQEKTTLPEEAKKSGPLSLNVPYRHLVTIYQVGHDVERALQVLHRVTGKEKFTPDEEEHLRHRLACVAHWLLRFAPDMLKFSLAAEAPQMDIDDEQKAYLVALLEKLKEVNWKGEEVNDAIYNTAKEIYKPKKAFQLLYMAFLGQKKGPRLGHFLGSLERDFVLERINHYIV